MVTRKRFQIIFSRGGLSGYCHTRKRHQVIVSRRVSSNIALFRWRAGMQQLKTVFKTFAPKMAHAKARIWS